MIAPDWEAFRSAVAQIPPRWTARLVPRPPGFEPPTPDAVRAGFSGIQRAIRALGPRRHNEPEAPAAARPGGPWEGFAYRWPNLHEFRWEDAEAFITERSGPEAFDADGLLVVVGWLRGYLGHSAKEIIMDVPAWFNEDPTGLREVAFEELQRVALLLPDRHQAGCLRLILEVVEMRAFDFARRLYHHPDAGPAMKAVVHEVFEPDYAAKLIADVPESHAPSPWL